LTRYDCKKAELSEQRASTAQVTKQTDLGATAAQILSKEVPYLLLRPKSERPHLLLKMPGFVQQEKKKTNSLSGGSAKKITPVSVLLHSKTMIMLCFWPFWVVGEAAVIEHTAQAKRVAGSAT
jgi:hypothetical protein